MESKLYSCWKSKMSFFNTISQVNDHLFIAPGRAVKYEALRNLQITCVVNATVEIPNPHMHGIEFVQVPVLDSETANICIHFDRVADKIHAVKLLGGKTLVHCVAGASRSASLCIAYLMKYQHMTLKEAFCYLQSKRKVVHPNNGFFEQLINYEQRLFGSTTVRMVRAPSISTGDLFVPDIYNDACRGFLWLKSFNHINKHS